MKKLRIYLDTSVVGGYFDEEFSDSSVSFFEYIKNGEIKIIVSDLLIAELSYAPNYVQNLLGSIDIKNIEYTYLTKEVIELAEKYIIANVVGKTSKADCQHIALATIANADALASWNFKHIVNLNKIIGYNSINYQNGYKMLEIRTPKEILNYE